MDGFNGSFYAFDFNRDAETLQARHAAIPFSMRACVQHADRGVLRGPPDGPRALRSTARMVPVAYRAGAMVVWDQRLPHATAMHHHGTPARPQPWASLSRGQSRRGRRARQCSRSRLQPIPLIAVPTYS
jgi:hypothetical protein